MNGGQSRAVAGGRVYVLQANTSSYGSSSASLLTSATGNPVDSIGYYALTSKYGAFSIAGDYTCAPGRQVYLYVRGGNSGSDGANSAIGLMASLGACPPGGNFDAAEPFVFVNEVTTVAAAYAMSAGATDATHVSTLGPLAPRSGIASAADLASTATGFAITALSAQPEGQLARGKLHTLANILSACINSGSPTSDGCATLFANAQSNGTAGARAHDTATAAIYIARNPHAHVAALYSLQSRVAPAFLPALQSAPRDFTISLAAHAPGTAVADADFRPEANRVAPGSGLQ
ncbi:MAG: hypothetical protein WBE72_07520 [Terracidiphilus sp.]